jgi:peptide/nickel transport system permease protein
MRFVRDRLIRLIPVLLVVSGFTFLLTALLPGDPALAILGDQAPPEAIAALRKQLREDEPMYIRYADWLKSAASGDLGTSIRSHRHVTDLIKERLPVSLELLVLSNILALAIAIPAGIAAAYRAGSRFDRLASGTSFGLLAVPGFVLGIVLIYAFAVQVELFPASGYTQFTENPLENLRSFFLPSVTLALAEAAVYMRLVRNDMISTLQEDYIAMARAKGLPPAHILARHALKPSSFTLLTVLGINIGRLIGGALIVETIFALPGVGRLLVESIYNRDLIVVQGVVLFVAVGYVMINFGVDMLYAVLDPRIRYERAVA